jgi:hypothetical protein
MPGRLAAMLLVGSLAVIPVGFAHGLGPIGLFMILGLVTPFILLAGLGWVGIFLTVSSAFRNRGRADLARAAAGVYFLLVSWFLFFAISAIKWVTFLASLPFFVCVGFQFIRLWRTRNAWQTPEER